MSGKKKTWEEEALEILLSLKKKEEAGLNNLLEQERKERSENPRQEFEPDEMVSQTVPLDDIISRTRKRVEAIKTAIERHKKGNYGICQGEGCGEQIDIKRLKAQPFALLCLKCQGEKEKKEVHKRINPAYA